MRKRYRDLRETLRSAALDGQIAENALRAFGARQSFFVYLSFGSEVGTDKLVRRLLESGKRVCVPRVEGGEMLSVPYSEETERDAFGIVRPRRGEDTECEVVFTPLLAADAEGYRLGYGGGYYDRYFAAHAKAVRVGLCYEGQFCEALPRDGWDEPLDALVTERGLRLFKARNA